MTSTTDYIESMAYDPNGNITSLFRNGKSSIHLNMDALTYLYNKSGGKLINNQLNFVRDLINSSYYTGDIDIQSANNYQYDATGNLVKDNAEGITDIKWNVYGKIQEFFSIEY